MKRMRIQRCGASVVLLALSALVGALHAQAVAFVNANVLPLNRDVVLLDQTVLVQHGRIVAIGATGTVDLPRGVVRVDATGKLLLPGLIELHGHIPDPRDVDAANDRLLVYAARGVTSMRGVQTHETQVALQRRTQGDDVLGPRLFLEGRDSLPRTGPLEVLRELRADAAEDADASTYEWLRRVTVDAARTLGIEAEAGTVEVGKRADLLLIETGAMANAQNMPRIAGVMLRGRWVPHEEMVRQLEDRARDRIYEYYTALPTGAMGWCRGLTLYDCFGGDSECGAERTCNVRYFAVNRKQLLDRLDLLAVGFPASDLLVGQRVNFALKHHEIAHAIAIAESCAATPWWCQALRGYALNWRRPGDGRLQLDSAYVNAPEYQLAWATPPYPGSGDRGLGCEWSDLATLLPPALREEYRRLPCGVNRPFEARYWWLADPLWSLPGNERRGEQFARNVAMRLHDEILRALSPAGYHPQSHHMRVMPAGLPNSVRIETTLERGRILNQRRTPYVHGGYSFGPDTLRFRHPLKTTAKDWELKWDERVAVMGEREKMITLEKWYNLEHQTAVLRRGARLQVLAAAPMPLLLPSYRGMAAFLAMGRPSDGLVEVAAAAIEATGIVRATTEIATDEWLASIEVVADTFRARARHGAPAPELIDGFGVSDLVLVHERFERERMALLAAMLPTTNLGARDRVGLYFELYGLRADEPLRITLTGRPVNQSLFRALAGAVGLGSGAPLNVAWLEPAGTPTADVLRRFFVVDLSSLDRGDYELLLTITRGDGSAATSRRQINLLRQR